jgi:hypothetical protein
MLWGMDGRYFITYRDFLRPGDVAVVYNHGGIFPAVIKFTKPFFFDKAKLGWKKGNNHFLFPYRIPFGIIHESKIPIHIKFSTEEVDDVAEILDSNFIDKISFIADKGRTWNQYFQVSIISITLEDFTTISDEIKLH